MRRPDDERFENLFLFIATITPICIPLNEPEKSKNFVNYTPFVAGWG